LSKKGKGPKKGGKKKTDDKFKDIDGTGGESDELDDMMEDMDDIEEEWDNLAFEEISDDDLVWDNFEEGDEPVPSIEVETGMIVAKTSEVESPARKVIESLKARANYLKPEETSEDEEILEGNSGISLKAGKVKEDIHMDGLNLNEIISRLSEHIKNEVEKKTKDLEEKLKSSVESDSHIPEMDKLISLIDEKLEIRSKIIEENITSLTKGMKVDTDPAMDIKIRNILEGHMKEFRTNFSSAVSKFQEEMPKKEQLMSMVEEKMAEEEKSLTKMLEQGIADALTKVELIKGVSDPVTSELLINSQDNFSKALAKAKQAEKQSTEVISRIGFAIVEAQRASSTASDASTKMDEIMANTNQVFSKSEEILSIFENRKKELDEILKDAQDILKIFEFSAKAETDKVTLISKEALEKFTNTMEAAEKAYKRGEEFAKQINELTGVVKEAHSIASQTTEDITKAKASVSELYEKRDEFTSILDKNLVKLEQAYSKAIASEEKTDNALNILSQVMEKSSSADKKSTQVLEQMKPFEDRFVSLENSTVRVTEKVSKVTQEVSDMDKKLSEAITNFNAILQKSEKAFEESTQANQRFEKLAGLTDSAQERSQKALEILDSLGGRIAKTESDISRVENKAEVLLEMALQKAKAVDVPEEVLQKFNKVASDAQDMISRIDELKVEAAQIDSKIKEAVSHTKTPVVVSEGMTPVVEDIEVPEESDLPLDLDDLLLVLVEHKASDLHLKVGSPPYVRLEGSLIPVGAQALTEKDTLRLIVGVMKSTQRITFKKNRNLSFSYAIPGGMRFRVNVFYEKGMVSAAIRMLHIEIPSFEKLGLPVEETQKLLDLKSGIILISGPVGAGKSTTVASIINYINQTKKQHIITIEDPIEFLYRDRKSIISQREIGADTHSYACALKEAIQQDPDVIVIGEIKESEIVELANMAAEAGKLIVGIVRASNSVQALERLVGIYTGKDHNYFRYLFAYNFKGMISQKLIRLDKADSIPMFEIIWNRPQIRDFIIKGKYNQLYSLIAEGGQEGIISFSDSLNELVKSGKITPEEALKHKEMLTFRVEGSDSDNIPDDSMLSWL